MGGKDGASGTTVWLKKSSRNNSPYFNNRALNRREIWKSVGMVFRRWRPLWVGKGTAFQQGRFIRARKGNKPASLPYVAEKMQGQTISHMITKSFIGCTRDSGRLMPWVPGNPRTKHDKWSIKWLHDSGVVVIMGITSTLYDSKSPTHMNSLC